MSARRLAFLVVLVAFLGVCAGLLGSGGLGTLYLASQGRLPPLSLLVEDPGAWWRELERRQAGLEEVAAGEPPGEAPIAADSGEPPVEAAPVAEAAPADTAAPAAPPLARRPLGLGVRGKIPHRGAGARGRTARSAEAGPAPAESEAAAAPEATPSATASSTGGCQVEGVTQIDSTHYILSRAFVNKYIRDSERAQKQGYATWANDKGGDRAGVRLKQLRCAPRTAGLRNGDVVRSVNGKSVTSTLDAWAVYREVQSASRYTVVIKRKGSPLTLHYEVR
jgi:hypothetical protein